MSNELTKQQSGALATGNAMNEMFGNEGYQIPVDAVIPEIKILRESAQFEMPDGSYAKEFNGHILHWHNANQFWMTDFESRTPDDSPMPNCLSSDGIVPDDLDYEGYQKQCTNCRECPMNQYGSADKGEGKKCQNTIRLYILVDGEVVPCLLKAPPSSLGKKESLVKFLMATPNICEKNHTAYQCLDVKVSLYKKEFGSGMSASVIKVELASITTDESEIKKLASITREFKQSYLGKVAQHMAVENNAAPAQSDEDESDIPI